MTWEVGDLAVCIGKGEWHAMASKEVRSGPAADDLLRVRKVGIESLQGQLVLWFDEWPGDGFPNSYVSDYFRKVVLKNDEACETEFVTLLKRIKEPHYEPAE